MFPKTGVQSETITVTLEPTTLAFKCATGALVRVIEYAFLKKRPLRDAATSLNRELNERTSECVFEASGNDRNEVY